MDRMFAVVLVGSIALWLPTTVAAQSEKLPGAKAALEADIPSQGVGALPPVPGGTSTIFGGAIRKVDPVLDQIQLNVYGARPMKILFDERTQLFRDGTKVPLHDLKPTDHASVQTTLDGEKIFAISIHILSHLPQGQYRGLVLGFDRGSGELSLDAAPSPHPFRVHVPDDSKVTRVGQSSFASEAGGLGDLRPGSLVEVNFGTEGGKEGVASQITVLAVPGADFVFSGNITALDTGSGFLAVTDPRDQKSYRIGFDARMLPEEQQLRVGQRVRIIASYQGGTYLASDIKAY